jgi:hypothetical protein
MSSRSGVAIVMPAGTTTSSVASDATGPSDGMATLVTSIDVASGGMVGGTSWSRGNGAVIGANGPTPFTESAWAPWLRRSVKAAVPAFAFQAGAASKLKISSEVSVPSLGGKVLSPGGAEHAPVAGSHVPPVWHASIPGHTTGPPLAHVPAWHVSPAVHGLPSLHAAPSIFGGLEHAPVAGSQVPTAWHWSLAVHTTEFAPTQAPAWHVSFAVHALPSLHTVPFAAAVCVQTPAEQESTVQTLPSLQLAGHAASPS